MFNGLRAALNSEWPLWHGWNHFCLRQRLLTDGPPVRSLTDAEFQQRELTTSIWALMEANVVTNLRRYKQHKRRLSFTATNLESFERSHFASISSACLSLFRSPLFFLHFPFLFPGSFPVPHCVFLAWNLWSLYLSRGSSAGEEFCCRFLRMPSVFAGSPSFLNCVFFFMVGVFCQNVSPEETSKCSQTDDVMYPTLKNYSGKMFTSADNFLLLNSDKWFEPFLWQVGSFLTGGAFVLEMGPVVFLHFPLQLSILFLWQWLTALP